MAIKFPNVPGVKIQELRLGPPPIVGVSTSIGGFVGKSPKPLRFKNQARLITSADQFTGDYLLADPNVNNDTDADKSTDLSRAVFGFFANGGTSCYVVNTDAEDDTSINAGIDKLEAIDEIAIIAAPGRTSATVYKALEDQAARTGDRFAILDPPAKENVSDSLVEFLPEEPPDPATDKGKRRPPDSQYAAFYYPRVLVGPQIVNGKPLTKDPAPDSNSPSYVTPVGHIAGVYARVDNNRGVHKAPAAEGLAGVLGVEHLLTDSQQDAVNLEGINLLRVFAGNVVIWGARTLQSNTKPVDADYKYINVRRLVNYIEESLQDGLRWAVFEPNTLVLQKQITRSVRGFLDGVWRDGGLFGESADNAYYVRFPAPFNRDEDRAQGKLTMEVGLRVTYPAEFIIIRIGIITQDASTA